MCKLSQRKTIHVVLSVVAFYAAMVLLNANALFRIAENMEFDACGRGFFIAVMKPLANFSHAVNIDVVRNTTETFERKYLE